MESTYRAWLAGFFDGEGCVLGTRNNGTNSVVLAIVQKDRAILEGIQESVGCGSISRFKNGVHTLRFNGRDSVLRLIDIMLPYSVVKKEKLDLARELVLTIQQGGAISPDVRARRIEIVDQLRVRPPRG